MPPLLSDPTPASPGWLLRSRFVSRFPVKMQKSGNNVRREPRGQNLTGAHRTRWSRHRTSGGTRSTGLPSSKRPKTPRDSKSGVSAFKRLRRKLCSRWREPRSVDAGNTPGARGRRARGGALRCCFTGPGGPPRRCSLSDSPRLHIPSEERRLFSVPGRPGRAGRPQPGGGMGALAGSQQRAGVCHVNAVAPRVRVDL